MKEGGRQLGYGISSREITWRLLIARKPGRGLASPSAEASVRAKKSPLRFRASRVRMFLGLLILPTSTPAIVTTLTLTEVSSIAIAFLSVAWQERSLAWAHVGLPVGASHTIADGQLSINL